jgi:hypothetical protein
MREYSRIFESTSCLHNVFPLHMISLMWPKLLNADGGPWPLTIVQGLHSVAAISWETTTTNVVKKVKCHPFIGSMGSVAIHNDQSSIRKVFGLGLKIVYFGMPKVCDMIIGSTFIRGNITVPECSMGVRYDVC